MHFFSPNSLHFLYLAKLRMNHLQVNNQFFPWTATCVFLEVYINSAYDIFFRTWILLLIFIMLGEILFRILEILVESSSIAFGNLKPSVF